MDIYVDNKKIRLSLKNVIGKGGEADVYKIGRNEVIKVFKTPNHPDLNNSPLEQKAAENRLQEHQIKLNQFPHNLPDSVIKPHKLATDKTKNQILGYTMPFLTNTTPLFKYGDRNFRSNSGVNNQTIINIFLTLHDIIKKIHQVQVVIGDFNDLNILIKDNKPYLIDADSYQFGQFLCGVYTTRFVDPLLCDETQNKMVLNKPHNSNSDWYAFTTMLMQSLLFVNPYGGVYKPKNKSNKIPHSARPLKRITVFNKEVKYPKPALPYNILSDDLLQYFHRCFEEDKRGEFPLHILGNLQWQKCQNCGLEYAQKTCPNCTQIIPIKAIETVIIRGQVSCTNIYQTQGIILTARLQEKLNWIVYENGEFKREDGRVIFAGNLDIKTKFWLNQDSTLIGKEGQIIIINSPENIEKIAVDSYDNLPVFNCHEKTYYWLYNGQLLKQGKLGQEYIGDVLINQTKFWVGNKFGFGYYHAGNLQTAFIFELERQGINDQILLPNLTGQLIDTNCIFSDNLCWFFISISQHGKLINKVYILNKYGAILAQQEVEQNTDSWLANIHGHCAVNNFLLALTDEGLIKLEIDNNQIIKTKEFPDTEPFINSNCQIIPSKEGLYVIEEKTIKLLQIKTN